MNKIKKEFLGRHVLGALESAMWVLSMWLMKKGRRVVPVMTSIKGEHVSLQKPQSQLAQLHDDDKDVFATSLFDRYGAMLVSLQNMCLATFAVTYDVIHSATKKLMVSVTKKKKCRKQKMIKGFNCKKDWVSSGKGNRKQYYIQEGTKSMQNQENIAMQSCFCIIHGKMRMTSYHHLQLITNHTSVSKI